VTLLTTFSDLRRTFEVRWDSLAVSRVGYNGRTSLCEQFFTVIFDQKDLHDAEHDLSNS